MSSNTVRTLYLNYFMALVIDKITSRTLFTYQTLLSCHSTQFVPFILELPLRVLGSQRLHLRQNFKNIHRYIAKSVWNYSKLLL